MVFTLLRNSAVQYFAKVRGASEPRLEVSAVYKLTEADASIVTTGCGAVGSAYGWGP